MNPEKLFEEVSQFVSDSRTLLEHGAMMELAGLENRVLLLCEEIVMLSQEERIHYADKLQQLMADLTALGEEIKQQRDKVGEEMLNLPSHKKAHTAYRNTDASDKEGDD